MILSRDSVIYVEVPVLKSNNSLGEEQQSLDTAKKKRIVLYGALGHGRIFSFGAAFAITQPVGFFFLFFFLFLFIFLRTLI